MQPERLPTDTPPPRPRLILVTSDPDGGSIQAQKRRSDRILTWSVLASLGVNALFVALLSHADLFGQAPPVDTVKHIRVQVYKPPVVKPPVIRPSIVKPPVTRRAPPPPVRTPRARHTVTRPSPPLRPTPAISLPAPIPTRPQPSQIHAPTPQIHAPTPQVHAPAPQIHAPRVPPPTSVAPHVTRTASARPFAASPRLLPAHTAPFAPPTPRYSPSATPSVTLPTLPDPKPEPPKPAPHADQRPAPRAEAPSEPKPAVKIEPRPEPKPEPKRPSNWTPVETQDAAVRSVPDPDTDGIDAADVHGSCVVSFEVGENGRVSSVGLRKSSGNADFDRACQEAMRRARCVPAIQDHIPQMQRMTYSFNPRT